MQKLTQANDLIPAIHFQRICQPCSRSSMSDHDQHPSTDPDAPLGRRCSMEASEAADCIAVMRLQEESDSYRCVDYFTEGGRLAAGASVGDDGSSGGNAIDATCRTKMCQWCEQVVDFCNFDRDTVSVSMALLDRFLSASLVAGRSPQPHPRAVDARLCRKEYQLASMTALYIAVKLSEPVEMDTELVSELSRGCYSARDVADMEMDMLDALGWKVNGPTPAVFLAYFLALLPQRGDSGSERPAEAFLLDAGCRQAELAASDSALVPFNPSTVAVAALVNALEAASDSVMSANDKIALLTDVRNVTGIEAAGDEVYFVRSRLIRAFKPLEVMRSLTLNQNNKEESQEQKADGPPAAKRRCSHDLETAEASVRSPVSVVK